MNLESYVRTGLIRKFTKKMKEMPIAKSKLLCGEQWMREAKGKGVK